jgi:phage terminase small subunit
MRTLDPKEQRFVEEYLKDLDPKRAALAAGYSATVARTKAFQWVSNSKSTKPHVMAEVRRRKTRRAKRAEVTAERVLKELASLGFASIDNVMEDGPEGYPVMKTLGAMGRRQKRAIESITVTRSQRLSPDGGEPLETVQTKVKMHSKTSTLRMLMDHLGMDAPKKTEQGSPGDFGRFGEMSQAELEAEAKARAKKLLGRG